LDGLLISFHVHFFPNCTRYQCFLLLFFSNQKFYEQEITKCIIVQETITYLSPLHPQKTTHKHVAFTVFLYRQKVSSSPESYSPKNGVLSYFIASIDLELFTTSPKPPIFNLSNNKSIINFLTPPHFSSKLEVTFIDCPMEYHLWWDKENPQILTITPYPLSQNLPPFKKNPCSSYFFLATAIKDLFHFSLEKKGNQTIKKEKIKKSRPKKKKIFSAIIKRKKYNTQKGCFKILLKCKHPIFPPYNTPSVPLLDPSLSLRIIPPVNKYPLRSSPPTPLITKFQERTIINVIPAILWI